MAALYGFTSTMRYSTDRKPAGFDKAATTLRCNREEVPFV